MAIQGIMDGVKGLFEHNIENLQQSLQKKLEDQGVQLPESVLQSLHSQFTVAANPFKGLETPYLQNKYLKNSLHYLVRCS